MISRLGAGGTVPREDNGSLAEGSVRGASPTRDSLLVRLRTATRYALPALAGYAVVRAIGVVVLLLWDGQHGTTALHRLATMWDAYWYQEIADHGYSGTKPMPGPHGLYQPYAFFPVYPVTIRAVGWVLPLSTSYVALLVAWAASLAAAWGIFAVAARLYGRRTGVIAAVLWGVLPYAVVESMAYSELMFTAFAAWTMYAAVTRRWVWAGVLCTLAGLTRPTGVAVAAAVGIGALWAAVTQWTEARRAGELRLRRALWLRPLIGGALAPVGFAAFVAWVGVRKGRWDGYFRVQDAWESHFDYGKSTYDVIHAMITVPGGIWLTDVVVTFTLAGSLALFAVSLLQRQPLTLVVFSGVMLLLAIGDAAYFNSRARFLLPAFALLLPLAAGLARVRTRGVVPSLLTAAALCSALYGGYVAFVYTNSP
ncbi:glycosyltransferase family 39 protein [Kitasatospora sp. NA04385]|uniref:glycosyltransferase family 39 protein n=1 Tax=Kitasatospora sp. NA04385 TaxID=2742135 RepID=UPI0015918D04|nr:glycosyltransferase family 39 protein [Kitasatospora sp. NA04385]QKW19924.1 glycosyltransferase family 39 protein [Kitasatospora sp. NA04385]